MCALVKLQTVQPILPKSCCHVWSGLFSVVVFVFQRCAERLGVVSCWPELLLNSHTCSAFEYSAPALIPWSPLCMLLDYFTSSKWSTRSIQQFKCFQATVASPPSFACDLTLLFSASPVNGQLRDQLHGQNTTQPQAPLPLCTPWTP